MSGAVASRANFKFGRAASAPTRAADPRGWTVAHQVGETPLYHLPGHRVLRFEAGLKIDADGSPRAYHPQAARGLDDVKHAGRKVRLVDGVVVGADKWWGIATDESGEPLVQGPRDPAPGYYVPVTALSNPGFKEGQVRRAIDAESVPYVVVPRDLLGQHVHLGDLATVVYDGGYVHAIVADAGGRGHLGEGSIALARALGLPHDPKKGGVSGGVTYYLYPGSGNGKGRPTKEIEAEGERLWRQLHHEVA